MLCLFVHAGSERLAIQAAAILEVVPAVRLHEPVGVPSWVAGVFRFRGVVTPVIDLHRLAAGGPCPIRLSTRIVIVEFSTLDGPRPLGLLAERVTELKLLNATGPGYAPGGSPAGPDLGPLVSDGEGVVRVTSVARLVPAEYRETLFGRVESLRSGA